VPGFSNNNGRQIEEGRRERVACIILPINPSSTARKETPAWRR
jgi:hypothetical protein